MALYLLTFVDLFLRVLPISLFLLWFGGCSLWMLLARWNEPPLE